jgi:hypothetical protein
MVPTPGGVCRFEIKDTESLAHLTHALTSIVDGHPTARSTASSLGLSMAITQNQRLESDDVTIDPHPSVSGTVP